MPAGLPHKEKPSLPTPRRHKPVSPVCREPYRIHLPSTQNPWRRRGQYNIPRQLVRSRGMFLFHRLRPVNLDHVSVDERVFSPDPLPFELARLTPQHGVFEVLAEVLVEL